MYPATIAFSSLYFDYIMNAYTTLNSGDTIRGQDTLFGEDLVFDQNKTVFLEGGYNCDYSAITGTTVINGDLIIRNGTVIIQSGIIEIQ